MALIGNHSRQNLVPLRQFAGTPNTSIQSGYSEIFTPWGATKNRYYGGFAKFSSTPNGHSHPMAWVMPQTSGGLAAYTLEGNVSTTDALLAIGIGLDAGLSASMTTTDAILALIVALEASLTASGTITDANMAIIILLEAALSASGTITDAQLNNILNLASAISASGTLSDVALVNLVNLSADISNASEGVATPEQIAAAVWNAILADYANVGSTGEALSNAGGAGNPWDSLLSANNDPGTFGERVQKLLTQAKFLGLK
jgi:hypothetical protein